MSTRTGLRVLLIPVVAVAFALSIQAQEDLAAPKPKVQNPNDSFEVVRAVATSLGMLRKVLPEDPAGKIHAVAGILFVASGTRLETKSSGRGKEGEYRVVKLTEEVSYVPFSQGIARSPGIRWDYSLVDASGHKHREVAVAAGDLAWDQTDLGSPATPAMDAANGRMREIWLTPHGLIWAALLADGTGVRAGVTVTHSAGNTVLTIPVGDVPAIVVLDADYRPERVSTRIHDSHLGDVPLEISYSDYKDFERAYFVFFPAHITEKRQGRTVLDLNVTEFHTNPYVVFPAPPEIQDGKK